MKKNKLKNIVVVLAFFCIVSIFGSYNIVKANSTDNEYPDTYNANEDNKDNASEDKINKNNIDKDITNIDNVDKKKNSKDNSDGDMTDEVNHYLNHYKEKLEINQKYKIFGSNIIVQDVISDNSTYIDYKIMKENEVVTVKSFVAGKYVQLQDSNDNTYYETIENFYRHSIKSDAGILKKSCAKIYFNAMGYGSASKYVFYIFFAIIVILMGIVFINRLDIMGFKPIEENVFSKPNGTLKIIAGAMFGTFITLMNMFDKNMCAYYFLDNGFSLIFRNYNLEMFLMQIVIIIICKLYFANIKESFITYEFTSALIRSVIITILNIITIYVCYTLSFAGIAIYAVMVTIQCTYHGLEKPVYDMDDTKAENVEVQTT